jgi:hypothetical protein
LINYATLFEKEWCLSPISDVLQKHYDIQWKRVPAYATIRKIIHGIDNKALEKASREFSGSLIDDEKQPHISLDGKTIRGSFDHFQDQKAIQVFSALFTRKKFILAHKFIEGNKTNEIPVAQELIKELGIQNAVITADAMHCQKKRCKL